MRKAKNIDVNEHGMWEQILADLGNVSYGFLIRLTGELGAMKEVAKERDKQAPSAAGRMVLPAHAARLANLYPVVPEAGEERLQYLARVRTYVAAGVAAREDDPACELVSVAV